MRRDAGRDEAPLQLSKTDPQNSAHDQTRSSAIRYVDPAAVNGAIVGLVISSENIELLLRSGH
jgi:hypothetical protein